MNRSALEGRPDGWKFTATFPAVFDYLGTGSQQKYTFCGVVEQHGYIMPSGAWVLTQHDGDMPSYRAKVRQHGKRRLRWLIIDRAIAIDEGWER